MIQKEVQETADEVNSRGGNAHAYMCDVTKSDDVKVVATKVRSDIGDVYMVVSILSYICKHYPVP